MKKLTPSILKYFRITTRKRTKRHHTRKLYKIISHEDKIKFVTIEAPTIFGITRNQARRSNVFDFIRDLKCLCRSKTHIKINFSKTQKMITCGTLIFTAELRNILNKRPRPVIRCIASQNGKVMQVLKQIGVLDILKYKKPVHAISSDVINWKFTSGKGVNGKEYDKILSHLDDELDQKIQEGLYQGLTEAMTNTCHHAYIQNREQDDIVNDTESWWAFSQVRDRQLCVVFCDLGIGIPKSLPIKKPDWYKIIDKLFGGKATDEKMIKEAIKLSVTRTGISYRGKGLCQLVRAVDNIEGGYLSVLSNYGGYCLDNGEETTTLYAESLGGTLIEWVLPLTISGVTPHAYKNN